MLRICQNKTIKIGFLKNRLLIFLLFILSSVFSLQSVAQNYIVNSNIDAVAANLVTGETATPGQITLRSAIQAATAQPGAHIITFSGAVASPINLSLGQITLGNAANGNNITISGPGMNLLTVNQTTENRIFSTGSGAVTILLQDITLNYSGPAVLPYSGGGGAIIAGGAGAASTFINCRFTNFQRQLGNGGAISQSSSLTSHNLIITNCIFTNNRAGGAGGAVSFNSQGGTATITGCTFDNNRTGPVGANTGGDGGAVSVTGGGSGGTYLIEKNTFLNNQVENVTGHAGAVMNTNGTLTLRFNRFVGNTCANVANPPLANIVGQAGGATTHVTVADNNWWGVNTGPGANDATALAAGAVMTLTKWLQLKSTASPNPICASSPSNLGHTSTVTASFLSNSANEAIAVGNLPVLIGLPVSWTQTLGSLSAQQFSIQAGGTATAFFTSNGTGGTATVNASVDNIPPTETTPARANITVNTLSTPPSGATGTTTICYGTTTTLTVDGGFKGTGAVTQWYTVSCGGTLAFTGDVFTTPALTTTTTYYVRYSGDCNTTACATVIVTVLPQVNYGTVVSPSVSHLVISQVYGGGGNSGATYTHDFIEIFNPTGSTISVTGWSVQYASATGTSWSVTNLSGSIAPGKYYLVQEAVGAGGTTPLPTPDATGTIAMSATVGKVALVNSTVALSGSGCPFGASIVDFVGFGTTANCFEGAGPTPAPSNTNAVLRAANGCTDTDNNSTDFSAGAPTPRNSASPANLCASTLTVCSGTIPGSMSVTGASGGSGAFTYQWYSRSGVICPTGTDITGWTALTIAEGTGFNTTTFTPTAAVTADITFAVLVTAVANGGLPACPPPTWANGCRVVVVNNLTGGTIEASQSLCTPADPAAFSETAISTGDGTLTYQWESSTVSDFSSAVTVIPSATLTTYDAPAGLTITTYYRRVTTSTLNGVACTTNSNILTVTVNPDNTITLTSAPGTNAQTVCINTPITNITYSTTGATGASFIGLPAGVSGAWAANVVTISGSPTTTVGSPFAYTVNLTGGCGTISANGSISVTPDNTITLTSAPGTNAQTKCINTAITDITYSTTGATGANFIGLPAGVSGAWAANVVTISGTPTTTVGSPFNYTVTLTGGCGNITANGSITVTPDNTITLTSAPGTNAQTVCISTPIINITYATTGATGANFIGLPPGVNGNWAANVVTISGSPNTTVGSPFNYTVNLTGGCGTVSTSGSITVAANNTITLTSAPGTNAQLVVVNNPITNITYATTGATGANFSGLPAGVSGAWAANVVTISGSPTALGLFNYTVTLTGGCGNITATGSITVIACSITLTSAAGTNAQTVCLTSPISNITYATVGATGANFSGLPAGVSGAWLANVATISGTPTVSGNFNYTVTLTGGGCGTFTATGSITVNPTPTVDQPANQVVCTGTPTTTVTFSGAVPGTIFNWTNNNTSINLAASGTGNIASFNATNVTNVPVVATITVTPQTTTGGSGGNFAYVANYGSNTVSVVNIATNAVVATIPVGLFPYGVSVTPDGSNVYIGNATSNNVSVISTATNTLVATIPVGSAPFSVRVSPDGTRVYVCNYASNSISVINTATNTVTTTFAVNSPFGAVVVSPDNSKLYVSNYNTHTVTVVNASTFATIATIPVGTNPGTSSILPDGSKVFVANRISNTVSVINTATNSVDATIPVGNFPDQGSSITPDGSKVFVSNANSNDISVINTVTNTVTATIPGFSGPAGISFTADGSRALVANRSSNSVSVVNTVTNSIIGTIPVGISPFSVGNFIQQGGLTCTGAPKTFTITVNPLPTITCPGNQSTNNTPGSCSAIVTYSSSSTGTPAPAITYAFTGATTGSGSGNGSGSAFNVGVTNVTLTATNSCGVATCSFTVTVIDNQPPVITTCAANITSASDAGLCTKTFTVAQIGVPIASDNCSYVISWSRSDAAPNLADPFTFGITTITWTATDPAGLTATCTQTININSITTNTTVTVTPNPQQYSDRVTFVATVTPNNCAGAGPIGGTVTFKIGTLVMGTAPVLANGTATLPNVALLEPSLAPGNPPNGPLKPGTKTVTAVYSGIDADYTAGNATTTLEITCEDARAYYTGACYASTASPTSSNAVVTLSATIKDISVTPDAAGDVSSGDIRNATVTFYNWDNFTAIATVPVGLVNPGDLTVGTATYNWNVTISGNAQQFTIGIIVNNYYCRNSSDENTVVTVAKPLGDLFITGGGYLVLTNSAGIKAGTAGTKNNFGFNVKYNKAKTNLQGNINTIVRKMEGSVMRVYQIKGNVMTSLVVNENCPKTAIFNGKANIKDITNPSAPVSIDGNATLQVKMTDNGEPGSEDSIAITLWNKDGGLWFASNWNGTATIKQVLGGGNLKVHGGGSCEETFTRSEEAAPTQTEKLNTEPVSTTATASSFKVLVYPNPSASDFSIQVYSPSSEPIVVRILDINGVVKGVSQVYTKNSFLKMGAGLPGGTYFAEVTQGVNKQMIKLIKLN